MKALWRQEQVDVSFGERERRVMSKFAIKGLVVPLISFDLSLFPNPNPNPNPTPQQSTVGKHQHVRERKRFPWIFLLSLQSLHQDSHFRKGFIIFVLMCTCYTLRAPETEI